MRPTKGMTMLEKMVFANLQPDRQLCPTCCMAYLVPGTLASDRFGVCPACHKAALAEASKEKARYDQIERENWRARQQLCRIRKEARGCDR